MKILLVSEDLPAAALGGLGMHVVALGNALIRMGHDVTLMGRDKPDYAACATSMGFLGAFIAGFGDPTRGWKEYQLGVFLPAKRMVAARSIAKGILRHAKGFEAVHYHGHYPMVGLYLPRTLNFLQTRHDQGTDCLISTRFRAGQVCNEIAPQTCAGCISHRPSRVQTAVSSWAVNQYRQRTAEAFQRHRVVYVSDFLQRNATRALGLSASARSQVIHNFADEEWLAAQRSGVPPGAPRIVMAGRLEPSKGFQAFLRGALPVLPAEWSIDLYGNGPQASEFQQEFGRNPQLRLHGHATHTAVVAAMASATMVVMPSEWEEAFGFVTLEALRLGKVCYALARGATPELARYGAPGQLRLFDDMRALVRAMVQATVQDVEGLLAFSGGEPASAGPRLQELLRIYSAGAVAGN